MSIVDSLSVGLQQIGRARLGLIALAVAASCLLLSALLAPAPAAAACPNEVFRSGPSAKLPECRAYELVTPEYTGGIKPTATNFSNFPHGFEFPLITDAGNSVSFNTVGGAFSGDPGNGFSDRYHATRTANGWVTEFVGPTAAESSRPAPGGVAADHDTYFFNSGLNDFNLEPESILQAPFGGLQADYVRLPNGDYELIAIGTEGFAREAEGHLITPGGKMIFTTEERLEPEASPSGTTNVYERTPGGPTHVVSLLPDGSAPADDAHYLGASPDGTDVAFHVGDGLNLNKGRWYVRRNGVTKEAARSDGAVVGKELTCDGSGSSTIAYQWLRNGTPIGAATGSTYTPTAADAGASLQCLVEVAGAEAISLDASQPPILVAPFIGKDSPVRTGETHIVTDSGFASVGETVACNPGPWDGDPTLAYQWFRDGAEIAGATGSTYAVGAADEGESLQCRVTASNSDGTAVSFTPSVPVRPALPAVSDDDGVELSNSTEPGDAPEVGDELSCSPGTWSGSPTIAYQWLRNGTPIGAATGSTYTVTAADEGTSLQCLVTAGTADADVSATSNRLVADPQPATAPPESTGSTPPGKIFGPFHTEVGGNLECYGGQWSGEPAIAYQWLRDGAEIGGATTKNYEVTAGDLGSVVQCRVTASNAGGATTALYAGAVQGPRFATSQVPDAGVSVPLAELVFGGVFGGHLFYGDRSGPGLQYQDPGDLYSYDIAAGTTTVITDTGDAKFSHVSRDGSHVYFTAESEIGGEGTAGKPNLYVWSRADDSTDYIATAEPDDAVVYRETQSEYGANLASWAFAMAPDKESVQGMASAYTRATPDGSVFLFMTTAQLTSFNNTEETPEDCFDPTKPGERCPELYRYDTATEELDCVSCPPQGSGPAKGRAYTHEWGVVTQLNPPSNLSQDGSMVVFESSEDLLPQDGNELRDVYRWRKGEGLALISTGQEITNSYIYGITPSGSDIAFTTTQKLLPEDENGGAERIYDARVNGGFPPPEDTVTEPCSGDACQGNPSAAPEAPSIPSSSLNGTGNVKSKLKCPKGKRKVVRKGKERCVKRKGTKNRRGKAAGRKAGAKRGANR